MLNEFGNVSRLFELGDDLFDAGEYQSIAVYSLTLFDTYCIKQTVCDIHVLIQATIEAEASLILSKCGELMILSCAARGEKCMMSKWYPIDDDFEQLAMKLDPANICFRSAADFFLDIIYCAAPYLYFSEPVEGVDDHLDYDDIVDNVIVDDVTENDDTAVEMDLFDGTFDNDVPDEKILSDPLLIVKWLQTH
ncbi:MAG: hypothetical protein IJ668_00795 [Selenomonadaceae bacterium]|nr:hypothetical protein [Selenomonadaceae bacterium]